MVTPTHRALLIGIDYYAWDEIKNLNGCVNDVIAIEAYLQSRKPGCIITKLTARCKARKRVEADDSSLPTYQNIVQKLKELSNDCQSGDLVYIHYSGHGVSRGKKELPDDGGNNLMGMALVPTDAMVAGNYLTGYHLGLIVKEMIEIRGARDTVILDVGSAQGVCVGAIYNVYTGPGLVGKEECGLLISQICITAVDDFMSEGTPINESGGDRTLSVKPGNLAILQKWALPEKVEVCLLVEDSRIRSSFESEILKTPNLDLVTDAELPATWKDRIKDGDFTTKIRRRKASSVETDTDDEIDEKPESFEIVDQDEVGRYKTKEGKAIWYTLGYHGCIDTLWLAVFELNASWGVEKRYPDYGKQAEDIRSLHDGSAQTLDTERGHEHLEIITAVPPKFTVSDPSDTVDKMLGRE
ncbi:hypothetical protein G7Z17_g2648 [Cylindrodendrum hubeiense]|uniref:Peptidase C14 caspase domain-containing protein n=1 Tax=Cylindrodendrum hubeiense TaxID=595255 RepID=A0A9P5HDX0_9HYPO|nr:hypothetical protein G7Z17_g2648 [Cylindrodendrum hubeiense]